MYKLISDVDGVRTYRSEITGTEVEMILLKTTPETGEKWWGFRDLLNIPFIRKKAAESLTQLYGAGITKLDLEKVTEKLKGILKGNDPDKYERAYSEVLQLESIVETTADPIKQSLALTAVYVLSDTERPDTFSNKETAAKMEHWALQPDLQGFFLRHLQDGMNAYTILSDNIIQIASSLEKLSGENLKESTTI